MNLVLLEVLVSFINVSDTILNHILVDEDAQLIDPAIQQNFVS